VFANIFFLFLILLIIGSAPDSSTAVLFTNDPRAAFGVALCIYLFLLGMIWTQNRLLKKNTTVASEHLGILANIELLTFFIASNFILGVQRVFQSESLAPFNDTLFMTYTLGLYFWGLFVSHLASSSTQQLSHRYTKATSALRYLLPFVLPFCILVFLGDFISLIPYKQIKNSLGFDNFAWADLLINLIMSCVALLATMILLPPLLIVIWKCPHINDPVLEEKLEALCTRAHFRHAGLRIWTIVGNTLNAAIIGILGPFRYIIFTPTLLKRLSPNAIEAVLAHEIGHNKHRHLLIYPAILLGMLVSGWLIITFVFNFIIYSFNEDLINHPSPLWSSLVPLISLIVFVITCALYFRFIFGYFSRQFERQADLYIYNLKIPSQDMIEALDEIAHAAGGIHKHPNWHHCSIQERIDFLKETQHDPALINQHHRKVRRSLIIYFLVLGLAIACLVLI